MFSGLALGYLAYAGEDIGMAAWIPLASAVLAIGVAVSGGDETREVVYRAHD